MLHQTSKELLAEIKKYMDINEVQVKDLAARIHKSQQSVSQYFNNGNPNCNTLIDICNALDLKIEITKSDSTL
jgi:transcriptional regulator with XRE-family HTH domain